MCSHFAEWSLFQEPHPNSPAHVKLLCWISCWGPLSVWIVSLFGVPKLKLNTLFQKLHLFPSPHGQLGPLQSTSLSLWVTSVISVIMMCVKDHVLSTEDNRNFYNKNCWDGFEDLKWRQTWNKNWYHQMKLHSKPA